MKRSFLLPTVVLAGPFIATAIACGDDPAETPPGGTPDAGAADAPPLDSSTMDGGADSAGTDLPKAGSRLVPRFVTTADGLKAYVGIIDTKLDAQCLPSTEFDT